MIATQGHSTPTKKRRSFPKSAPVDPDQEAIADNYADEVLKAMWNSVSYRVAAVIARGVSLLLFELGNWWSSKGKYRRAARLEFRAYLMDKQNVDAWQSYLLDRQALIKTASCLTDEEKRWVRRRGLTFK
jgi:hypothetical protein